MFGSWVSWWGSSPPPEKNNDEDWETDCVMVPKEESKLENIENTNPDITPEGYVNVKDEIIPMPTAYCKFLDEIKFDISEPLTSSSHNVFRGIDTIPNKHYLKQIPTLEMAYVEVFLSTIYRYSLLYGTAYAHLCCDQLSQPAKITCNKKGWIPGWEGSVKGWVISSKEIPNLRTFKDAPLTKELLDDPLYSERFMEVLAELRRMCEDDANRGNIGLDLTLPDPDCAMWPATCDIKGDRSYADKFGVTRDPKTAFDLLENDARDFPDGSNVGWYYPCQNNPWSRQVSDNPWLPEEVALVQGLQKDDRRLAISFDLYLDWMLDVTPRFENFAHLCFPPNLCLPNNSSKTLIQHYVETNQMIDAQYWKILPNMPEFKDYIETNHDLILMKILVRSQIRNHRLDQDKAACPQFAAQFDHAKRETREVIEKFMELIQLSYKNKIYTCSKLFTSTFDAPKLPDYAAITSKLEQIAKGIAGEMIALEKVYQTENWRPFYEKFHQLMDKYAQCFRNTQECRRQSGP